jgi:predicted dehydrogenase
MEKVRLAILGMGMRALEYGLYSIRHFRKVSIAAVADPDESKLDFVRKYGIKNCCHSWQELLDLPERIADVVIICTPDYMHAEPARKAMEKGYHIIIEKPLSPSPSECLELERLAREYDKIFMVAHVLRYTKMYSVMKKMVEEGKIGGLVTVEHSEYVERIHQSHSYVRGTWRNSRETAPMILTKSCHDMDIMAWLAGESRCKAISSFGGLYYFRNENAPEGAPDRCQSGCPAEDACPYHSEKVYVYGKNNWWRAISRDKSREARRRALGNSPYGRCVFKCDNDVVDHQAVSMEFENGVTGVFTMTAFSKAGRRTKLMGTKGELEGSFGESGSRQYIKYFDFETGKEKKIVLPGTHDTHAGGDDGMMDEVVRMIREGDFRSRTSVETSVHSHMMCFSAEKARLEKTVVDPREFEESVRAQADPADR